MAKNLKKIESIVLISDDTGTSYDKCQVTYSIGSTDDSSLESTKYKEYTLTGTDLTDVNTVWDAIKAMIDTDEGL